MLDVRRRRRGQVDFRQVQQSAGAFVGALPLQLRAQRVVINGDVLVDQRR